ncbi:mannan endo-1,4-beta-mannosidase A and B [Pedobacter psychrodurus]|uniref:Mannan endo-1,4-beta-mannosidase A and B n=1 Tax=Pedobacter psychrodurus TaxID=2530456 RepID=A0A4R0PYD2_9SPHI|nr:glycosyl hydrolase [Pedobacter psychrodurus]TCD26404.1 mannan endo-1,4-beta-mannosidase A and B [Pedobacter psychrodurus]
MKTKNPIYILTTLLLLMIFIPFEGICRQKHLSNKDASKEANALYAYLKEMYGKKILSGQMSSSWGVDEINYIKTVTGKSPAINGYDFITAKDNQNEVNQAIQWWKTGGIPTIMWHMGAPGKGEGYESSKKAIDTDNCFIKGTAEYEVFWAQLKEKGDLLLQLKKANVPVLWRPFHELNGNWFWWGKQGPDKFKKLWITMYEYYTKTLKLDNLIWVLCYTGKPDGNWYPGDKYVDVVGADTYDVDKRAHKAMYDDVNKIVNNRFPIAFHECGTPPDPDKCLEADAMWSWWMVWHTNHLTKLDKDYLIKLYNHELVITKDEIPDIVKLYGNDKKK